MKNITSQAKKDHKGKMLFKSNKIVAHLLITGCIQFNFEQPFTYANGKTGPTYVDVRKLLSHPKAFKDAIIELSRLVCCWIDPFENDPDYSIICLAGGETAGIPFATCTAYNMGIPSLYVRKAPKDHGSSDLIVGGVDEINNKVILLEDLCNNGFSKIQFVKTLQANGLDVIGCASVFGYGSHLLCQEFIDLDIDCGFLCDWQDVINLLIQARDSNDPISKSIIGTISSDLGDNLAVIQELFGYE